MRRVVSQQHEGGSTGRNLLTPPRARHSRVREAPCARGQNETVTPPSSREPRRSGERARDGRGARAVLISATATMALLVTDSSIVGVMLPSIDRDVGLSDAGQAAVVASYLLTLAIALPFVGPIIDRVGAFTMFVVGNAAFVAASIGIASAGDEIGLILWRAAAGVAAAVVMPATMTLVAQHYPEDESRTRALAIYTGVGQGMAVLAPILGGAVAQFVGWQWGFLLNVPIGLVAILLVLRVRAAGGTEVAVRAQRPVRTVLASRRFVLATALLSALGFSMTIATVYGAVAVQDMLGLDPLLAGLALLPLVVPLLVVTRWTAAKGYRVPAARLGTVGAVAMAAGLAVIAGGLAAGELWIVALGMVPAGAGIALVMGPISSAALGAVPPASRGTASAVATMGRQFGGALGAVAYTAVAGEWGSGAGFAAAALVILVGALAGAALRRAEPVADGAPGR
jgi:DHA2 family methylenomycin A resistance protein-like MFS transporter